MEFHKFPIGPVLEYFGFDPVADDRGWHAVRCAFHGDRDASGSVNTEEHVYNCFVCEMKGSATQLLMRKEGLSYGDALKRAEEITGDRNSSVHGRSSYGSSVSGGAGNHRSYREIRRAWLREESDSGSRSSDG